MSGEKNEHKVIVFGSLNMDLSVECTEYPRRGQTVLGRGFVTTPGGKGGNQAVACARMGADTFMVGKVGADTFGQQLLVSLTNHGVSVGNVSLTNRAATGTALVVRSGDDNRIVVDPGANQRIRYEEVRSAIHGLGQDRNIFLTQLECDFDVTMDALRCANRNYLYTILNAAPAHRLPHDVYQTLDLLCVNESECELLSGIRPVDDASCAMALGRFADLGVRHTVITLGSRGSVTTERGQLVRVSAHEIQAVDTTGAGDAYLGELAAHLAFGGSIVDGMRYATAAAALCCTKVGAQDAMPTWDQVEKFAAAHRVRS
ncbi:MAG: ribokinase [Olsenella uli]|uniref:ribokinase n=1 Tax=Olsenella uli TaxID=133926 RepID=UPI001D2620B4|nr:ribokinase [Olsenella uli]MBS6417335.1 ribokinase [Olsenella uli]